MHVYFSPYQPLLLFVHPQRTPPASQHPLLSWVRKAQSWRRSWHFSRTPRISLASFYSPIILPKIHGRILDNIREGGTIQTPQNAILLGRYGCCSWSVIKQSELAKGFAGLISLKILRLLVRGLSIRYGTTYKFPGACQGPSLNNIKIVTIIPLLNYHISHFV